MRAILQKIENRVGIFTGVFKRCGITLNQSFPVKTTYLLIDIKDTTGKIVADHLWFIMDRCFKLIGNLQKGDLLQFKAKVVRYKKYGKGTIDYGLVPLSLKKLTYV